jgi:hypothetical protein
MDYVLLKPGNIKHEQQLIATQQPLEIFAHVDLSERGDLSAHVRLPLQDLPLPAELVAQPIESRARFPLNKIISDRKYCQTLLSTPAAAPVSAPAPQDMDDFAAYLQELENG